MIKDLHEIKKIKPYTCLLKGKKAAILVGNNFHIHEAYYPFFRLKEAGMDVVFVGEDADHIYYDYNGEPLESDISIQEALKQNFDLIHCPGGFAPMKLRANNDMLKLAKNHFYAGKLFTSICHAAGFLVTMNILKNKKATCYITLKDDLINAGANYIDDAPVIDGNLITARTPDDLPEFMEAIVRYLEKDSYSASKEPVSLPLSGKNIAILVENRYQVHEVWYPYYRFKAEGAAIFFVGGDKGVEYLSRVSKVIVKSNRSVKEALEENFHAIIVPGDWAADKMRNNNYFQKLIKKQITGEKLLVSIAEGHSILISANVLKKKKVSCLSEMILDLENAGAYISNSPVHQDDFLLTGRSTDDLPELMRLILGYFLC
jgi:protease I